MRKRIRFQITEYQSRCLPCRSEPSLQMRGGDPGVRPAGWNVPYAARAQAPVIKNASTISCCTRRDSITLRPYRTQPALGSRPGAPAPRRTLLHCLWVSPEPPQGNAFSCTSSASHWELTHPVEGSRPSHSISVSRECRAFRPEYVKLRRCWPRLTTFRLP
jgi:hypothetical protein